MLELDCAPTSASAVGFIANARPRASPVRTRSELENRYCAVLEDCSLEDWEARRLEATVQTAALCAYVDDHLAPEEREKLCECIATYASSESQARRLLAFAKNLPEWIDAPPSGYRAAQFAQIRAGLRTREERRYAYYLAAQVAAAHRGVSMIETSLLLNIMHELDIDRDYAREVLEEVKRQAKRSGSSV